MKELIEFLEQHPHLKSYQDRLERDMNRVPEKDRLKVLAKHIAYNMEELEIELKLLQLRILGLT